ncbi:MAG TPA: bifunctional riboflavin kinase/FAD synthetase [Candidatus Polarisedimenticolaceae bacterium]|nr:bifunctional riboflavin kinase/FAD synthetase [Candidatus Polarisedimenticolaceae bacterium]
MEVFRDIENFPRPELKTVVTMGNFDGIHLGHQALVGNSVAEAKQGRTKSVVFTFEPHPLKLLAPERAPQMILSHQDKMDMLQTLGVDAVIVQTFDRRFASIGAEDFVRRYLLERLNLSKIWLGRDLRFGRARQGDAEDLIRWGIELGFRVGIVEPILVQGKRISSSRIRQLIQQGRLDEAQPMLGRYHFVSGRVVSGHHRGRNMGFPTANLAAITELLPQDGIYATILELQDQRWLSVSSVGYNPTFGEGSRSIEAYILDFAGDIYGEAVKLNFVQRIREERMFAQIEDLVTQMHEDVQAARAIFDQLNLG